MGFSKKSNEKLNTCDDYIQRVMRRAIELSPVDFGIAQGSRSIDAQRKYFKAKKSKVNPDSYTKEELPLKAKHIVDEVYTKSGAVDIYAYIARKGASWDIKHLCLIAGVIMSVDKSMENRLRWGGNWDGDGEIIYDQRFQDLPHFELNIRLKG